MRRWRLSSDDEGSASLEFIVVGLILLVPIVYLVVTFGAVQSRALGIEATARHVARAVATAPDTTAAHERADRVVAHLATEYDLDPDDIHVAVTCAPAGVTCPEPGALITIDVTSTVRLPLAPAIFGLDRFTDIPISATSVQKVSRVWGVGG